MSMNKQNLIDFETSIKEAWEAGKIKAPVHLCGGNEDQLIEIFKEIKRDDFVFSTHRNHSHALLHGVPPNRLYDEILGLSMGTCKGSARSMGFIDSSRRFYSSAIVGGLCAVAVGTAWALQDCPAFDGEQRMNTRVWCFVGDGTVDGGHFWEALQYAHGWDLPITFVIEDNNRATCTSVEARLGTRDSLDGAWRTMLASKHIWHYEYIPTFPHVSTGKYVQF